MGADLIGVGDQIGLAEHHALGRSETAGREQDDARIGGPRRRAELGRQGARRSGEQLVSGPDLGADILQVDDLGQRLERIDQVMQLALLDEPVGGQHGPDPGQLAGGLQVPNARCEVQHGRHPAKRVQGEEGHHAAGAGRQHHADPLALAGEAGDPATQGKGRTDQAQIGEGRAFLVLQDRLARAIGPGRSDQGVED